MAEASISYKKLEGTGSGAFDYTKLYAGPDHLLQVTSTGYNESYRRFYFRDIQSIRVRKSGGGKTINGVLVSLAVIALGIGLSMDGLAVVGWCIPGAIFLLILAINMVRGPTCLCQIQTAVQVRKLPSIKRLRQASKFRDQLRPHIEAAQEALAPGEIVRRLEQIRQGGFYSVEEVAAPAATGPVSMTP